MNTSHEKLCRKIYRFLTIIANRLIQCPGDVVLTEYQPEICYALHYSYIIFFLMLYAYYILEELILIRINVYCSVLKTTFQSVSWSLVVSQPFVKLCRAGCSFCFVGAINAKNEFMQSPKSINFKIIIKQCGHFIGIVFKYKLLIALTLLFTKRMFKICDL